MGALTSLPVSGDNLVQLAGLSADLEEPVEMTPKRPSALENSVGSSARVNCHRGVLSGGSTSEQLDEVLLFHSVSI